MTPLPLKKALVTGAAGDLGSEIGRCLAARGLELVLTDLDAARLAEVEAELRRYPGCTVSSQAIDLRDQQAAEEAFRALAAEHPDIDLLLAVAGVDRGAAIEDYDWRIAKLLFDVNTLANYVLFSVFVPRFLAHGHGHVAAVISLGGLIGMPYEHAYNGSKSAMRMLMDGLRAECRGRGVSFTSIFPGYLEGSMIAGNRFNVKKATPIRVAAEAITRAVLERRAVLAFPRRDALKIALSRCMPLRLRDRLALAEMLRPDA